MVTAKCITSDFCVTNTDPITNSAKRTADKTTDTTSPPALTPQIIYWRRETDNSSVNGSDQPLINGLGCAGTS